MKPNRRDFLRTLVFGILGKGFISSLSPKVYADLKDYGKGIEIEKGYILFNLETQKSMEALADTLLPGAKEVGIRKMFMDYASKNHGIAGYLDSGFWNLDTIAKQRYKKPYYQLETKEQKDAVLKHVYARNRRFINIFRNTVIRLHYSNPEAWKKLSYNGPPQPRGFMDYTLPPK